jgi:hypothetical protein
MDFPGLPIGQKVTIMASDAVRESGMDVQLGMVRLQSKMVDYSISKISQGFEDLNRVIDDKLRVNAGIRRRQTVFVLILLVLFMIIFRQAMYLSQ